VLWNKLGEIAKRKECSTCVEQALVRHTHAEEEGSKICGRGGERLDIRGRLSIFMKGKNLEKLPGKEEVERIFNGGAIMGGKKPQRLLSDRSKRITDRKKRGKCAGKRHKTA